MARFGFLAGGLGQGLTAGATAVSNAYNQAQILKLEQQKNNIAGYSTFNQMLQTMDPDTLKAYWPQAAKNLFNTDPNDADTKAFYMQAIDKTTQTGQAVQNVFSSLSKDDPNSPILGLMKNVPLQTMATMSKDPEKLVQFFQGVGQLKQQSQAQDLIKNLTGGGQPAAASSAPTSAPAPADGTVDSSLAASGNTAQQAQAGVSPAPAPAPVTGPTLNASMAPVSNPAPAAPVAMPAPAPAPVSAPAPMPQAAPTVASPGGPAPSPFGTTQSVIGASPKDVASSVATLRSNAIRLSGNIYTKPLADQMLTQADALEKNFLTSQQNQTAQGELGVARQNAATNMANATTNMQNAQTRFQQFQLDKSTKSGWTPVDNTSGTQQGLVTLKNPAGDMKVIATDPARQKYYDTMTDSYNKRFDNIQSDAESATNTISGIANLRAINNGGIATAPAMGTAENARYVLGKLADSVGLPDIAKGITGTPAGAEVSDAIKQQLATAIASKMRSGSSMGSFSKGQATMIQEQLPELSDTPDGRNQIMDILQAGAQKNLDVYKIWSDHQNSGLPPFVKDANGQTAEDKTINYLNTNAVVAPGLQKRLNVSAGTQPITATGHTTTPVVPVVPAPQPVQNDWSSLGPDAFKKSVLGVGAN